MIPMGCSLIILMDCGEGKQEPSRQAFTSREAKQGSRSLPIDQRTGLPAGVFPERARRCRGKRPHCREPGVNPAQESLRHQKSTFNATSMAKTGSMLRSGLIPNMFSGAGFFHPGLARSIHANLNQFPG